MGDAPRVSIVMPVYKAAKFVREAVESALAQTMPDFELVIADNQSPDGTFEILSKMAAKDPRIKLERNERNLGMYGNHNRVVERARAPWVKILHGDDRLHPNCLERLLAEVERNPGVDLFLTNYDRGPGVAGHYAKNPEAVAVGDGSIRIAGVEALRDTVWNRGIPILFLTPTASFFRREAFAAVGPFREDMMSSDLRHWALMAFRSDVVWVGEPLCTYREHDEQGMQVIYADHLGPLENCLIFEEILVRPDCPLAPSEKAAGRRRWRWFLGGNLLRAAVSFDGRGVARIGRRAGPALAFRSALDRIFSRP